MKKNQKDYGFYIFLVFLGIVIIGGFLVRFLSDRTVKSRPGIYGNSTGNLYNMGQYCDDGERIYFSNLNDQGLLYSMNYDLDDFRLVVEDNARYINADDNYIYYSRMNNLKDQAAQSIFVFYSNGIFRIKKNGHNLKMLWKEPVGSVVYYDNKLYFQHYKENEKLSTHRLSSDGKNDKQLFSDESVALCLYNDKLYYAGRNQDRNLHSGTIADGATKVEIEGGFYNPVVNANGVYYIDINDKYKVKKCDHEGNNVETLTRSHCSAFNFSTDGNYMFYQIDDGDNSGLFMLNLNTGEDELIKSGYFKWINTVRECCFFVTADETSTYCYRAGRGLFWFDPPVFSK